MPANASGVRISWSEVPERVRAWVEEVIGGGPIVAAESQPGGFSPGTADRVVAADGRRAFVKAVSSAQNADSPDLHRREARVVAQLPRSPRTPGLLGSYDDGDWVALVLEDVVGQMPTVPWEPVQLTAVMAALTELAEDLTPSPVPELGSMEEDYAVNFSGWLHIRADPPPTLDPWVRAHLDELVQLAQRGRLALTGETVVHNDMRADNLLIRPDGFVTVVDWPWARVGAAWVDRLFLIVNVDLYGGHDPDALVAEHLAWVDPSEITAVLAGLCSYFTDQARRPPMPGVPTVRQFQADQAASTLAWLRRRWVETGTAARVP